MTETCTWLPLAPSANTGGADSMPRGVRPGKLRRTDDPSEDAGRVLLSMRAANERAEVRRVGAVIIAGCQRPPPNRYHTLTRATSAPSAGVGCTHLVISCALAGPIELLYEMLTQCIPSVQPATIGLGIGISMCVSPTWRNGASISRRSRASHPLPRPLASRSHQRPSRVTRQLCVLRLGSSRSVTVRSLPAVCRHRSSP
mmetsp:Transcript_51063/g.170457  ORF Transcript_51063/g.170457 Transcript_51063/m.170457 type:complete len:200 (-) Transcript_51063:264-863(-)